MFKIVSVGKSLAIRERELSDLLARIEDLLRRDQRVRAAWLFGSSSQGNRDALSDLDLWVVVADESANDFVEGRHAYAARSGRTVLKLDARQNAPQRGAYFLVLYPGEAGPLHVDWYWQPVSQARLPDDAQLLFDRVGLPAATGTSTLDVVVESQGGAAQSSTASFQPSDALTQKITFFWAMSLIVAKYIARGNDKTVGDMTGLIARTLDEARQLLNSSTPLPACDEVFGSDGQSQAHTRQFGVLYGLARDAEALHAQLLAQGAAVPSEALPYIYRFFELTESIVKQELQGDQ